MTKTYYQKEYIYIYYFLLILLIGTFVLGGYFTGQVSPMSIMYVIIAVHLSKNLREGAISLTPENVTILSNKHEVRG